MCRLLNPMMEKKSYWRDSCYSVRHIMDSSMDPNLLDGDVWNLCCQGSQGQLTNEPASCVISNSLSNPERFIEELKREFSQYPEGQSKDFGGWD